MRVIGTPDPPLDRSGPTGFVASCRPAASSTCPPPGPGYAGSASSQPGDASANATARAERAALCDLLLRLGPDAPTCCDGWSTRDLAAHLVVRERRPDAAAGIAISPLRGWTAQVQSGIAQQPWPVLVEQVRSGPPRWSPASLGVLDGLINTTEFFVHHEDVRRAQPGWEPRELGEPATTQLWEALARGARLLARHSPVAIVARPTDGPAAGQEHALRSGSGP